MNAPHPALQAWLRELRLALAALPTDMREDILAETLSHLEDRLAQGHPAADALAALGPAAGYARGFLDNFELAHALSSRRLPSLVSAALQRVHRSLGVAVALIAVSLLALWTAATVVTALMHFIDPKHWGLWLGPHSLVLGVIDDGEPARELLGSLIYPLAVLTWAVAWQLGRQLLARALRRLPSAQP